MTTAREEETLTMATTDALDKLASVLLDELYCDRYRSRPMTDPGYWRYEFYRDDILVAQGEVHASGFIRRGTGFPATCVYCGLYKSQHVDGDDCAGYADEPTEGELERYTFGTPPEPPVTRSELTR